MEVLAVIDGLGTGGAERSLAETAQPLRERGIELVVAYQHRRRGAHEILEHGGFTLIELTSSRWAGRALQLRRIIRRRNPALVHATLVSSSVLARVAAARTGAPVLSSIVNTAPTSVRTRRGRAVRFADGWTARHLGAAFHAITEAVRSDAADHLRVDPDRFAVISRGRSRERLGSPSPARREAARRSLGIPADAELVVAIGRQERQKGHDVLVRAWQSIAEDRPMARLVVAGRAGRATPAIERALRDLPPPISARVDLLGHVEEIGDLLAAADLFVLPSRREGQAGALIEAFALGVPAVVTDLPALREAVDPDVHGLLVPPDDPSALANAVGRLLDAPESRARMREAMLTRFDERYDLDRVVDEMSTLYRNLAAGAGRLKEGRSPTPPPCDSAP